MQEVKTQDVVNALETLNARLKAHGYTIRLEKIPEELWKEKDLISEFDEESECEDCKRLEEWDKK